MKLNTAIALAVSASLACAVAAPQIAHAQDADASSATASVTEGEMLYTASGKRLAAVYRTLDDGSAHVILNGKMYVVPAATLSVVDGKATTSLSKREVIKGAR